MIGTILRVRYEIAIQLSDGPIFATYLARDRVAGKEVTIRVLKPPYGTERSFVDALSNSVRQLGNVNHPGIERIDEIDEDQGITFLVGQLSPGITLTERISKLAPFSVPVSIGTAISILEGLDALHTAGIVHGDVGAHNIVVGADGSSRLQMAGIWRSYSHSTTAGAVVLPTMAPYLAPEVSSGGLPSTASDVYAVGIILYELLCGRMPYGAETPVAMAMKHATSPTPTIKTFCPSAPMVLDEIVKRAMQKDPTLRYRNAGAMLSDLRILQDALRFGRSLTWPLTPEPAASGVVGAKARPHTPQDPQPVTPRMSAIREDQPRRQRREYSGDVPLWMWFGIIGLGALLGGLVLAWAFFNLRKDKQITVPALVGRDVADARQTLRNLGLDMREVDRQSSDTYPADTILRSDPDSGERIRDKGTVRVIVSTGSQKVEVPTMRGLTLDTAKTTLKNLNLDLADPVDKIPDAAPAGMIVDQDPPPHQLVQKHTLVHLRISTGVAPPRDSVPTQPTTPDTGPKTAEAEVSNNYRVRFKVTDVLTPVQVKLEVEDYDGVRTVIDEAHDVNDEINEEVTARGYKVTFRVYFDGEKKKEFVQYAPNAPKSSRGTAPRVRTAPRAGTAPNAAPPDDTLPQGGDRQP